ncbi:uncharacterized protein LOC110927872 [Helianthus annuus]|nr:uncharacterized protein LOC110927872 [Helianthus annuus]
MATSDPNIISALYTKFKIHQDDQSESSGVHLSEIQSVPCEVSKDEVSYTGDNETSVSNVMKSNQKSPSSSEVKRNLHEVYDVDNTVGSSSTKRRVSDENHEVQDSDSLKLLIPKIEK